MKKCRKLRIFSAMLCAALLLGVAAVTSMSDSDATQIIKITKADKATAEKVDKTLKKKKTVTLKVKGSAKKSKKLLSSIKNKCKAVNKCGVIFQSRKRGTKNGYTSYTVSADDAKTYVYTIKFVQKYWKSVRDAIVKTEMLDEEDGMPVLDSADEEAISVAEAIMSATNFCDLNDYQKCYVLSDMGDSITYNYSWNYSGKSSNVTYNSTGMKKLLNKTATGVCTDQAKTVQFIFKQLGMKSYYCQKTIYKSGGSFTGHAWAIVRAKGPDGKYRYMCYSNAQLDDGTMYDGKVVSYYRLGDRSKIYKKKVNYNPYRALAKKITGCPKKAPDYMEAALTFTNFL